MNNWSLVLSCVTASVLQRLPCAVKLVSGSGGEICLVFSVSGGRARRTNAAATTNPHVSCAIEGLGQLLYDRVVFTSKITAHSVRERHIMANEKQLRKSHANMVYARIQEYIRLLVYILLAGTLAIVDAALIDSLYRVVALKSVATAGLMTYFTTALAAITFLPLFARLRALADHALYQDSYDTSLVLQLFSERFGVLNEQDDITDHLLDSLQQTLNLISIAYVALPEGLEVSVMKMLEAADIRARGQYATSEGKSQILQGLVYLPVGTELLLRQKKSLRNPWPGCEALVLIESATAASFAGLLVVGTKRFGGFLQRKDRMLLETVAHLAGTAYANALLIQGLHISLVQVQTSTDQLRATRAELQLLLRELVSAEERERSALARDLHDDALQEVLYVIRHAQFCTRLASELEANWRGEHADMYPPAALLAGAPSPLPSERAIGVSAQRLRDELTQLANRSQVLEQKLRALCMGLYPDALRVLGLPTALEELAGELSRTADMTVTVYYDDESARATEDLLPERAVHLFRIAQEALTNAFKHAHANSCVVYLSLLAMFPASIHSADDEASSALWICLTIIDDGVGMELPLDMGALLRSGHLGLAGMRERAEQLEGRLDVRHDLSGGTRVTIMSPLVESPMRSTPGDGHVRWRITGN